MGKSLKMRAVTIIAPGNRERERFEWGKIFEGTTSNGQVKTIGTIAVEEDEGVLIEVHTVGIRTDGNSWNGYIRQAMVRRQGSGSAFRIGGTNDHLTREETVEYNAPINVTGNDIQIRVKGKAGESVKWICVLRITRLTK